VLICRDSSSIGRPGYNIVQLNNKQYASDAQKLWCKRLPTFLPGIMLMDNSGNRDRLPGETSSQIIQ